MRAFRNRWRNMPEGTRERFRADLRMIVEHCSRDGHKRYRS